MPAKLFFDSDCLLLIGAQNAQLQNITDAVMQAEFCRTDAAVGLVAGADTVSAGNDGGFRLRGRFAPGLRRHRR